MNSRIASIFFGGILFLLLVSCRGVVGSAPTSWAGPTMGSEEMAAYYTRAAAWGNTENPTGPMVFTPTAGLLPTFEDILTPTQSPITSFTSTPIPHVENTKLAAGSMHTCAVTPTGEVQCWGDNSTGQLGNGTRKSSSKPVDVKGLESGAIAVAAEGEHTCALLDDGKVQCWGVGFPTAALVKGFDDKVEQIAVGPSHACAILETNAVWCWGDNEHGQLGDGSTKASSKPVESLGLNAGVVSIAAGLSYSCALLDHGRVKCWGQNNNGQLGNGTTEESHAPGDVMALSGQAQSITTGEMHACAILDDGRVKCWGSNYAGQLGNGTNVDSPNPVLVENLAEGAMALATGKDFSCAITRLGGVKCWGGNGNGQLGYGEAGSSSVYYKPVDMRWQLGGVSDLATGWQHTCARLLNGGVKCWGLNDHGQLGDGTTVSRYIPVDVLPLGQLIATFTTIPQSKAVFLSGTCVITSMGGVKCWGQNDVGQLGNGTRIDSSIPIDVIGLEKDVTTLAIGAYGTNCALSTGGAVKCWGNNTFGQLGDGTKVSKDIPVDVVGLGRDVTAIAVGTRHVCAALRSGGVKCWGSNVWGQLGTGDAEGEYLTPVDVVSLPEVVVSLSLDDDVSCALTLVGAVKCWGSSMVGQLGSGLGRLRDKPTDFPTEVTHGFIPSEVVGLSSGVKQLSCGKGICFVLQTDGSVMGWGINCCGQLVDGTQKDRNIPVRAILPEGNVISVSARAPNFLIDSKVLLHSGIAGIYMDLDWSNQPGLISGYSDHCILTDVGSVKCWGPNNYGQLGDGSFQSSATPVDVFGFLGGNMR